MTLKKNKSYLRSEDGALPDDVETSGEETACVAGLETTARDPAPPMTC